MYSYLLPVSKGGDYCEGDDDCLEGKMITMIHLRFLYGCLELLSIIDTYLHLCHIVSYLAELM